MGVPGLFGWVSRKFPKCVEPAPWQPQGGGGGGGSSKKTHRGEGKKTSTPASGGGEAKAATLADPDGCDNLYLDLNGVIHPAVHKSVQDGRLDFDAFVLSFFEDIKATVRRIKPQQLLYLAVDGVAPRAKMAQQRKRRFCKGVDTAEAGRVGIELRKRLRKKGFAVPSKEDILRHFDTNCISPGTDFMNRMAARLHALTAEAVAADCEGLWGRLVVVVSDGSVPGEGEHKALTFIRAQRTQPGYNPNTRHTIEGLDADLMLLALATHEAHVTIVRPEHTDYKHHEAEVVRVNTIRRYLELEFRGLAAKLPFPFDLERVIDDFVLCCSLVGNDFLPHLPSIRIYDGALDLIFECYKLILPECSGYLTRDCKVDLASGGLARLMRRIGKLEDQIFDANERKRVRRYPPENRPWQERPAGNSQHRDAQVEAFLVNPDAVAIRWPLKALSRADEARLMVGVCLPDLQCWVDQDGGAREGHFTLIKPGVARQMLERMEASGASSGGGGASKAISVMDELRDMLAAGEITQAEFDEAAKLEGQSNISAMGETLAVGTPEAAAVVHRAVSKFFSNEVLALIEQKTAALKKKLSKNDSSSLRLQMPQHRLEYYRRFFTECLPEARLPKGTPAERIADSVASEYVRGMCWALEYYLHDCPSWGWLFPYHFAPLAQDMAAALSKQGKSAKLATFDRSKGPTSSISQLLCVLPRSSAPAVPNADAQALMTDKQSPLAASFETKMTYDTRGESRKWKWTAVFPFASPDQVMKAIADKGVRENPHGVERVYMRKTHPISVAARAGGGDAATSFLYKSYKVLV